MLDRLIFLLFAGGTHNDEGGTIVEGGTGIGVDDDVVGVDGVERTKDLFEANSSTANNDIDGVLGETTDSSWLL